MESLLKVRSHCTSDPHEGSRQTRAFVVCSLLGVRSVPNMGCLSRCPKVQGAKTESGLSENPQERRKSSFHGQSSSLLSHPHFCLLTFIYYIPHRHTAPSSSPVPNKSTGSWSEDRHFPWQGDGIRVPCTSHCESARPLLLHQRLSPPMPDFTAYLVLKSPFCLCHFISTNNSRLEDLFSKWLILQTIKREMLDSGSSQPLWHYLEICLAAPFFGCGRFETSDMDDCKMCCVCIKKGQVFCKKE